MLQTQNLGYLVKWVQDFLADRTSSFSLHGHTFESILQKGTLQGSPLSPVLFILGVNPLLQLLPKCLAYADDILSRANGRHTWRLLAQQL